MTRLSDHPAPYGIPQKPRPALDFGGDELGSATNLTPEQRAHAARTVASRTRDAADARTLLDICGLLPTCATEEADR